MCGASVVFHVKSTCECLKRHMDTNNNTISMESITDNSIRSYIKRTQIGCVGVQARFKALRKQFNAAHIQRSWFKEEHLAALDESR